MKKSLLMFAAFILLFSSSCAKEKEKPKAPQLPVLNVAVDPIKVQLLEQENFNIPYWTQNGAKDRTLVHISYMDGLAPLDENILKSLKDTAGKGDSDKLLSMGNVSDGKPAYSAENTVFAATRLGLVKDVYWVIPSLTSLTKESLDGFKEHLKKTYPSQSQEFDKLVLNGKVASGTISGIPVFIVSLQDLPKIDKPVLLDIDLSFFSDIYLDEKKTRILSLVSGFFKTLQESGLSSDMVSISASNKNGLVPYKFRFLADYFAELFANPKMLNGAPPKLWLDRADAWKMEQRSFKEAIPLYLTLLKEYPKDAATHYDLAYAYLKVGQKEAASKELDAAAALKAGYKGAINR